MKIACLGWGSLVWDPRTLPICTPWFEDGPNVPVEFTRQSNDGRITLVIDPESPPVRVLWAELDIDDLREAVRALGEREGVPELARGDRIGTWAYGEDEPPSIPGITEWTVSVSVDAVVWTALGPKFDDEERRPSNYEVTSYLSRLSGAVRDRAEKYIRKAPPQIQTDYRRSFQNELGWGTSTSGQV